MIRIRYVDEVHVRIEADMGYIYEFADKFSFFVPNYRFMPAYRSGVWDGKISMVDRRNGFSWYGLIPDLVDYCRECGYPFELIDFPPLVRTLPFKELLHHVEITADSKFQPRDYQQEAVEHSLAEQKTIIISPTASGKSFSIYLMARAMQEIGFKLLIIVPTVNLVTQLFSDFEEYAQGTSWNTDNHVHKVYSGQEKQSNKPIIISTWQSLQYIRDARYFAQYQAFICDEVHKADAKVLSSMIDKMINTKFRIGLTGTLKADNVSQVQLRALFGKPRQVATTKELMDRNILAKLKVRMIVLNWNAKEATKVRGLPYAEEVEFLVTHERRNQFITKLALASEGNCLLLFRYVEKHGRVLYDMLQKQNKGNKEIFFVSGDVDPESREKIRKLTNEKKNAIIVASYGVFSLGVNIVNIRNLVFASPIKAKVGTLQSIGRALRTGAGKTNALVVDLVDVFPPKKGKIPKNYAFKHFEERLSIYNHEGFDVEFKELKF